MKKVIYIIGIISLSLIGSGCGSGKKIKENASRSGMATSGNHDVVTLNYINRFKSIAKKEMKEYGIPASITLAQGILESNSGESRLAREANNHFGIKCADNWTGKRILKDDDHKNECFRVYNNPEDSYRDHSKFLAKRRRYAFLFRLPLTDYEAWAKGLKQAGYATDKSYPQKLIYLIEKYHLDKYDREVLNEMKIKPREPEKTDHKSEGEKIIYEVKAGETLYTIARKFNIPVRQIKELNNLVDFDIYEGQILVLKVPEEQAQSLKKEASNKAPETSDNTQTPTETDSTRATPQPDKQAVESIAQISPTEEPAVSQPENENQTASNQPPASNQKVHIVQAGETLYAISKKYGIDIAAIKKANNLEDNHLHVGQKLIIPAEKSPQIVQTPASEDQSIPAYHIVQPGETLYRIHVKYHISIQKIKELNGLKNNTLRVGQKIRLR